MSLIKNTPPEWKAEGVEPTEEIKKTGFRAGYKPPATYFNWFWFKTSSSLKELIDTLKARFVEGETLSTAKDTTAVANTGAEIFNDTRTRTYDSNDNPFKGNVATGLYAHAEGEATTASGDYSHAEGRVTIASGYASHAEGRKNVASDYYAHAEGFETSATSSYSHSEGLGTTASGACSHAEGEKTKAIGGSSHSEGKETEASGANAHAEGNLSKASGQTSHAEGYNCEATQSYSHAEGKDSIAGGIASHAEGNGTETSAYYAHAEGGFTTVLGNYSHGEGYSKNQAKAVLAEGGVELTSATDNETIKNAWNVAEKKFSLVKSSHSHGEGENCLALGSASHAEGKETIAEGETAHSEGAFTRATGNYSHAEGYGNKATGQFSHAEGNGSIAYDTCSHAEGENTVAEGKNSHTEGVNTLASGSGSHSEGNKTSAIGDYSHAEGWVTKATAFGSHTEGGLTYASGLYAHAEGASTSATGSYSHAEGNGSEARGDYSHASGYSSIAFNFQTSVGKNNQAINTGVNSYDSIYTSDGKTVGTLFIVGCGTDNFTKRENAFRVTADGTAYGLKAFQSSGADFAEYFEWADGNPDSEDRRGRFVTLDGEKIRLATSEDDYILGAVSTTGAFIGNSSSEDWQGKYMRDIFGEWLTQKIEIPEKVDEVTGEVTPAHTAVQYVLNPDYDPEQEYVSREYRKEWSPVGFHGQVVVVDDGTCEVNSYCKPSTDGVATASDTGYRVMARLDETHIKVLIR